MFKERSSQKELMDTLNLDDAALGKNLEELEAINNWFGGKTTLISALDKVYQKHSRLLKDNRVIIADLGCGGGDLLRAIHRWAKAKQLNAHLVGIDANPFMVQYASRKTASLSKN